MSPLAHDIDDLLPALTELRHHLHRHPELGRAEFRTSALIAEELRALGLDVATGVGGTGVVGILKNGVSDRAIGLRADMDALPIQEATGAPYSSLTPGIFHGCGHDGHMTMLLGAARHLARTRRFDGTVVFIFQPAEEGLAGARAMLEDGLFERFPVDEVYALHNWPDLPAGEVETRAGPIMAAADRVDIEVTGRGGHAAQPQATPDAILAASELVGQLNTIIARRIAPTESAVLSVTRIEGGHTHNVLPARVNLTGTVRSFDAAVQDRIEASIRKVAAGVALGSETAIDVSYDRYYPATINNAAAAHYALAAARQVATAIRAAPQPSFASEDFAFMLQRRPGAYIWLGQRRGDEEAPLHHPFYDFNDAVIGLGVALHTALAENRLSAPRIHA
ncbi:hippurate hydrolase [Labrys miyagiensis]|uniref:Hippurate hydrolase n=1 Tax=Labrys miyagiensis TaxID=346912 RepID=A0ABQ6CJ78_9HYPH|nr:M20 aminoacylase family protein [Labrys miyagiensis]GLS20225.1 hippurate hydrolase [Labrys miyagiensis]